MRWRFSGDQPQWSNEAAAWFHAKWGIPKEAYEESIAACLAGISPIPQWYLAVEGECILGGLGVIENDFHDRRDLTPNVCAVYVEEDARNQGIAGRLLQCVCDDCKEKGISTLYLVTSYTSFYERYGWTFYCPVQCSGEDHLSRMYIHKS